MGYEWNVGEVLQVPWNGVINRFSGRGEIPESMDVCKWKVIELLKRQYFWDGWKPGIENYHPDFWRLKMCVCVFTADGCGDTYPSIDLTISLSLYQSIYLSIYLSIHPSIHPSIYVYQ